MKQVRTGPHTLTIQFSVTNLSIKLFTLNVNIDILLGTGNLKSVKYMNGVQFNKNEKNNGF